MKAFRKILSGFTAALIVSAVHVSAQNVIQFTRANSTPEQNVQIHWASNPNEFYEIDYATNLVADPNTGTVDWFELYSDYPSQGTNTFWLDTGNYNVSPPVPSPKNSPIRFYRIVVQGTNTALTNPTISIVSPSNNQTVSSNITVSVNANSSDIIASVKLYVDGQEMNPSQNGTNFTINTCEWWNGSHTLFAVAKSLSHFEGAPNDTSVTYGRSVSTPIVVNFSNLISEVQFSQPYFEPSLGQTQTISATLVANCNWTIHVLDVNGNSVRTQTGSGNYLNFNWDGTGTGGTNIPDGVYTYSISAATNGLANQIITNTPHANTNSLPSPGAQAEMYVVNENQETLTPFSLYPPNFDTNGLSIVSATPSEVQSLRSSSSLLSKPIALSVVGGGYFKPMGVGGSGPSESTLTPNRPPTAKGKGTIGTFYVGYQDYYTPAGYFSAPPIQSGYPLINKWVQIDGEANQNAASKSEPFGTIYEHRDIANGFSAAMQNGRYKGSVNSFITASQLTSGIFNNANIGLLCCHASYGTTAESDGIIRSYLRFFNSYAQFPTYVKLDACNFGDPSTNGLKWMAILGCSVLQDSAYNSLHSYGKLPISGDLHLLLSTATVSSAAPTLGSGWANNMLGDGTTNNPPATIENS